MTSKAVRTTSSSTSMDDDDDDNFDVVNNGEEPLLDVKVEARGVRDILEALSEEEKTQLADPNMPLRHFRAEKGNTEHAIQRIKETIKWRREFEVEKIKHCMDQDGGGDAEMRAVIMKENETGKMYVRGYDKHGRAIMYIVPARTNSTRHELNNIRHLVYQLERAIACTLKKSGKEKFNIIIDYTGFQFKHRPPLSITKHTLDVLQKHYPERMFRSYFCHPFFVFRTFWTIVRPFVDPITRQKIVFYPGKEGAIQLEENFDLTQVEECAMGVGSLREFDSKEYLSSPFDTTFDEEQ